MTHTPAALARLHAIAMTSARPWGAAEMADLLAQNGVHITADEDAMSIGRTIAGEAELLTLATRPEARRQGHARRHLAAFEAAAMARDAKVAFLEVAANNPEALALYRAAGYDKVGHRRGYYRQESGPPVDAIVMKKVLSPQ